MGRDPRWVLPGKLVEVTQKAFHDRCLLKPSRELIEIFQGVLLRAALRYDVQVVAFFALSNHYHLLLIPADARQLALFMAYFAGNLAKEICKLYRWPQKIWAQPYHHVPISDEPEAQEARLRYLLAQGCKEHLVKRPEDWPGPCSTEALLTGTPVRGVWFNRSAEYEARRRNRTVNKYDFADLHELELEPLPAWSHLSPEQQRAKVAAIVREITAETRQRIQETGRPVLGVKRLLRQDPHEKPYTTTTKPKRPPKPKPLAHAASRAVRTAMRIEFYRFRRAYRLASKALRQGDLEVEFPPGCHRPPLPFVSALPPPLTP